jgi:hypothetical protein
MANRELSSNRPASSPLFTASIENLIASGAFMPIFFRIASARRNQFGMRHDFVHQPDAIGLLGANHLARKNKLERHALSDEPWQTLRAAAARHNSHFDLGLAESGFFGCEPDSTGDRGFASSTQRKAVHGGDDWLAKILDQIKRLLRAASVGRRLNRGNCGHFGEIRPCDERFVTGTGEDHTANQGIIAGGFEGGSQLFPGFFVECIEYLWMIDSERKDELISLY